MYFSEAPQDKRHLELQILVNLTLFSFFFPVTPATFFVLHCSPGCLCRIVFCVILDKRRNTFKTALKQGISIVPVETTWITVLFWFLISNLFQLLCVCLSIVNVVILVSVFCNVSWWAKNWGKKDYLVYQTMELNYF